MRSSKHPLLYFSPVDGGIEHSISRGQFLESLIYNLLLEQNGLLITDVFFFNCKFLIQLAERERHSLFTRALEEGLVVPAFRSEGTEDFITSLRRDIQENNVLGVQEGHYSTSPSELAGWLDQCYARSAERNRLVWPPDMGTAFGDLMVRVFTQGELDTDDDRLQSLWQSTQELREAALEDARLSTRLASGTGIRRGELYNSFGRRLELIESDATAMPRDLLEQAMRHGLGPIGIEGLRLLIDTVNLSYQRSQTTQFDQDPRYSVTQNIPGVLLHHAGSVIPELGPRSPAGNTASATFTMDLKMPSVETLLHADSGNLIAIRKGDTAEEYFSKRRAWSQNPTERAELELREVLQEYAAELVRFAAGVQEDRTITFVQRTINETINITVGSLVGYGLNKVGATPEVSLISGIAAGATAVVGKLVGDRPRVPKANFTINIKPYPEVILPPSAGDD
ncbi:hypothetical protein [Streptomyces sp. NPDC051554]|uniref:hypothetical protein n=1 Tax=Streptomyces sp. NPDC051554 TaxID=3365656 RepID=UPI0037BA2034